MFQWWLFESYELCLFDLFEVFELCLCGLWLFELWLFESLEFCLFDLIGLFGLFGLSGLFELCLFELFGVFVLCMFELWLFELWLFELWLFELFELCLFELIGLFGLFELRLFELVELLWLFALCFGFAFFRFAADLCAGLSESTRCAGVAEGPTFASALVVDGCYLCSMRRLEQVGAVRWSGKRPDIRVGSCCRRVLSVFRAPA